MRGHFNKGLIVGIFVVFLFIVGALFNYSMTGKVISEDKISISFDKDNSLLSVLVKVFDSPVLEKFVFNWAGKDYLIYDDSLVLMMNFDGEAKDLSRGDHSVIEGSGYEFVDSKYNEGLSFSEGEGLKVAASGDFNVENFTLSLWVKANKSREIIDFCLGGYSTCFISGENDAYCIGDGLKGNLGNGVIGSSENVPVKVVGGYKFTNISCGDQHVCALTLNGSVYCWGEGGSYQLGQGTTSDSNFPIKVNSDYNFSKIFLGYDLSCAELENGSVYCWGDGNNGEFGDGLKTNSPEVKLMAPGWNFSQYSLGQNHVCGLLENGSVYCWGDNYEGALGTGEFVSNSNYNSSLYPVPVFGNYKFKFLGGGEDSHIGVLENGSVVGWGQNYLGNLGPYKNNSTKLIVPRILDSDFVFENIYGGKSFSCGFLTNGNLACMGDYNIFDDYDVGIREIEMDMKFDKIKLAKSNFHYFCGLSKSKLYCMGKGYSGSEGIGINTYRERVPFKVIIDDLCNYSEIIESQASLHCMKNGSVYSLGKNARGKFGIGDFFYRDVFSKTKINASLKDFSFFVGIGCFLSEEGRIYCSGVNDYNSLGRDDVDIALTPLPINFSGNFTKVVSVSEYSTCGLLKNGSVVCWGKNNEGELCRASDDGLPRIVNGFNFSNIYNGGLKNIILEEKNGSVYVCGDNSFGQLGVGHTNDLFSPTYSEVLNNHNFIRVAIGAFHGCGLFENGSVVCWGANNFGQLGNDNRGTNSFIPVSILGNYKVKDIRSSVFATYALLENGSVVSWGRNFNADFGNLNLGLKGVYPYPIESFVGFTFDDFVFSDGSEKYSKIVYVTCLINDGEVYCAGYNYDDFLGKNSVMNIGGNEMYFENLFGKSPETFMIGSRFSGNFRVFSSADWVDIDSEDEWNNLVLVKDPNVFSVYINGEEVFFSNNEMIYMPQLSDLTIGKNSNADLDEIRLWNRSLSGDEIEMIYNSNFRKVDNESWEFSFEKGGLTSVYEFLAKAYTPIGLFETLRESVSFKSGSSGGSSGGKRIVRGIEIVEGYESVYAINDSISFEIIIGEEKVSDSISKTITEEHKMSIEEVYEDSVVLVFESEPKRIDLKVGESKRIDLDDDSEYDILVELKDISNFKSRILIVETNGEVVKDVDVDSYEDWKENKTIEEIEDIERKSNLFYWVVVFVLFVFIGLLIYFKFIRKK